MHRRKSAAPPEAKGAAGSSAGNGGRKQLPPKLQKLQSALKKEVYPGDQRRQKKEVERKQHVLMRDFLKIVLARMERENWLESNVMPYKDTMVRRQMTYRVKRVVSPFEFYLEYVLDDLVPSLKGWFSQMQKFYSDPSNIEACTPHAGGVVKGRCYVVRHPKDKSWHRCRVYEVNKRNETATVFFCDLGKTQLVTTSSLLDLNPEFTRAAACFFRAYLYDILPVNESLLWSKEACEFFQELVLGKEMLGIVLARSDTIARVGFPEIFANIGVVLLDKGMLKGVAPAAKKCTINSQMVDAGFAKSIGIFGGSQHALQTQELIPTFSDADLNRLVPEMLESKPTELPPIREITTREELMRFLKDEKTILSARPAINWRPTFPREYDFQDAEVTGSYGVTSNLLPTVFSDHLAYVKMSSVYGPSFIMVHLKCQLEDLNRMQNALRGMTEKEDALCLEDVELGSFIACFMLDSRQDPGATIWCRAVVKQKVKKTLKVLLIDYGTEASLVLQHCRRLPMEFHEIPSFAIRIHIDMVDLRPGGVENQTWSDDANLIFRRYVYSWEEKEPLYFLFRSFHSKIINFTAFNQDVIYNCRACEWEAGPERNIEVDKVINEKRSHTMLASLFRSVPVELYYEVMVPLQPIWFFESVMDILLKNGYGKLLTTPMTRKKLHLSIVESMNITANSLHWGATSCDMSTPITGRDRARGGFTPPRPNVTPKSARTPKKTPPANKKEADNKKNFIVTFDHAPAPAQATYPHDGKEDKDDLDKDW